MIDQLIESLWWALFFSGVIGGILLTDKDTKESLAFNFFNKVFTYSILMLMAIYIIRPWL